MTSPIGGATPGCPGAVGAVCPGAVGAVRSSPDPGRSNGNGGRNESGAAGTTLGGAAAAGDVQMVVGGGGVVGRGVLAFRLLGRARIPHSLEVIVNPAALRMGTHGPRFRENPAFWHMGMSWGLSHYVTAFGVGPLWRCY